MDRAEKMERVLSAMSNFFSMDDPSSSFARTLKDLMEACPEGVIVGGIALSFHVENPRATKDIDIVLLDEFSGPGRFEDPFEPVPGKPLSVRHKDTGIEVDLLTPANPVLNAKILSMVPENLEVIEQAGTKIRVAKPAVIIGLKLGRAIHNTPEGLQDRADILSLLRDNPNLDLEMVKPHLSTEEGDMLADLRRFGEGLSSGR